MPSTLTQYGATTVTVASTNATSCTGKGPLASLSGTGGTMSVALSTPGQTTLQVACTGAGGSANGSATVIVNAVTAPTTLATTAPIPGTTIPPVMDADGNVVMMVNASNGFATASKYDANVNLLGSFTAANAFTANAMTADTSGNIYVGGSVPTTVSGTATTLPALLGLSSSHNGLQKLWSAEETTCPTPGSVVQTAFGNGVLYVEIEDAQTRITSMTTADPTTGAIDCAHGLPLAPAGSQLKSINVESGYLIVTGDYPANTDCIISGGEVGFISEVSLAGTAPSSVTPIDDTAKDQIEGEITEPISMTGSESGGEVTYTAGMYISCKAGTFNLWIQKYQEGKAAFALPLGVLTPMTGDVPTITTMGIFSPEGGGVLVVATATQPNAEVNGAEMFLAEFGATGAQQGFAPQPVSLATATNGIAANANVVAVGAAMAPKSHIVYAAIYVRGTKSATLAEIAIP